MSTPPKAEKYRIRRVVAPNGPAAKPAQTNDMPFAPVPEDDGFGTLKLTSAQGTSSHTASSAEVEA
ncbi:MAG: hypothetical protein ORN49_13545, partial [Rhodobacteraceae bacterium]|nr:hypothetical protein [Paracoccaceae bacterium]